MSYWRELVDPGVSKDWFGSGLGVACLCCFTLAMALIGINPYYGQLYLIGMTAGFLLLLRIRILDLGFDRWALIFVAAVVAILVMYAVQVFFHGGATSELDTIYRLSLGAVNGAFFTGFFFRRNRSVFAFAITMALLHSVLAMGLVLSEAVALSRILAKGVRISGDINPIPFSEMLATSVGLAAIAATGKIVGTGSLWRLAALSLYLVVALLALFLTGTRGTLFVALPLIVLVAGGLKARFVPFLALVAVAFVGVFVLDYLLFGRIGLLVADLNKFMRGLSSIADLSQSLKIRLELWSNALELARSHPLLGYGLGSFPESFRDPSLGLPADSPLLKYNHLHNQYVDILLETGFLGLTLFLSVLFVPLIAGFRALRDPSRRVMGLSLIWVVASYGIFGLSQTFLAHSTTSLHFGVYLGILVWCVVYRDDSGWTVRRLFKRQG